ncbi:MORN repeat-containing protein [Desulfonispora thiosulfatigenes DSM 11270]|uniref:MORN repeat-containing protein n=1 Tax=Desulfonispora thiosulfatigenes DSM 11270 TaxID=656914 RepID=A0A1W1UR68_DESTI|nr:stalk domain-containing protein [Desulfonispora thiosulfatigenes]SMB83509.1 MORN repeat-containing protein [Desulfonispora thiosulfatigenes DSM 11270]
MKYTKYLLLLLFLLLPTSALAQAEIGIEINGSIIKTDKPAIIVNGRTMVPVRAISENLGADVEWNGEKQTVFISTNNYNYPEVSNKDNKKNINLVLNGRNIPTDQPPVITEGRVLVPLRFISEALGAKVDWLDETRIVRIDKTFEPREIVKLSEESIVSLEAYNTHGDLFASGSGFIIEDSGKIVTNYHVIKGATKIDVILLNGKKHTVTNILNYDEYRDIAILKINADKLASVKLGDSGRVSSGDRVIAIGNPLGLPNTVSEGLISNSKRLFAGQMFLQTTAPLSKGSSGGALINNRGEVIGITSAFFSTGQNINLAIPINDIKPFLKNNLNIELRDLIKPRGETALPDAPLNINIIFDHIITWEINYENDIAGFYVYTSDKKDTGFEKIIFNNKTSLLTEPYFLPYVQEKTDKRYYYITAVDANGTESSKSEVVAVIPVFGEEISYLNKVYYGQVEKGLPHGEGTMFWSNGDMYEGVFKDGKREGKGKQQWFNGELYLGHWQNDMMQGEGALYDPNNNIIYSGQWVEDYPVDFKNEKESIN